MISQIKTKVWVLNRIHNQQVNLWALYNSTACGSLSKKQTWNGTLGLLHRFRQTIAICLVLPVRWLSDECQMPNETSVNSQQTSDRQLPHIHQTYITCTCTPDKYPMYIRQRSTDGCTYGICLVYMKISGPSGLIINTDYVGLNMDILITFWSESNQYIRIQSDTIRINY